MSSIFQTEEWAKFKCQTGYEKYYEIDGIFVLQKKLPLSRIMLYSPMIEMNNESGIMNNGFIKKIKEIARNNKTIFFRMEINKPIIHNSPFIIHESFVKSFEEMQPEHTLILDITKSDEEILAQMKPKGRYNIKIAEKHGVLVKKTRNVDDFYKLYEQTAKRQKITYRDKLYFQKLLDNLEPKGYCELFVATAQSDADLTQTDAELNDSHCEDSKTKQSDVCVIPSQVEGSHSNQIAASRRTSALAMTEKSGEIVLAAAIISFYKFRATYLFGASSDEMRGAMAPYGLHWQIIAEAKRRGCIEYDFFGIAPDDDPKHPWAGVTSFKKKFGGTEVHLMGSWDLVFRPMEYKIFKILEKIRRQ